MSRAKKQYKKAKELATIYHENGCGTGEFMAEVYAGALLMYEWCKDRFWLPRRTLRYRNDGTRVFYLRL